MLTHVRFLIQEHLGPAGADEAQLSQCLLYESGNGFMPTGVVTRWRIIVRLVLVSFDNPVLMESEAAASP